MKRILSFAIVATLLLGLTSCEKKFKVTFDPKHEVSGAKFAVRDINPELPDNWDGYNFVVLEFKVSTAQRFHVGFTTDWGYSELRVMSYVPGQWNKLAIPLKFYTQLPGANIDLAATFNQPRHTGWINLGGERGPMHGVDSIGIRMRVPIGKQTFEIRNITLSVEDPGDEYLGDIPAVDEFGQSNLVDYPEKAHSLEELQADWAAEAAEPINAEQFNYSKYGGYKQKQVAATGFFRTEKIDGKWWFVDPEGYLFLSVGVDCIGSEPGGVLKNYDKRPNMFATVPPEDVFPVEVSRRSFGQWNLYRRYGENFREEAVDNIFRRMEKWGVNTIGNWSSGDVMNANRKAYMLSMRTAGVQRDLMGLADVYSDTFYADLDSALARSVGPNKDNPWVIGYFVGNEPAWIGEEPRLCQIILDGPERPIKKALTEYIAKNGDSDENRRLFVYDTFEIFVKAVEAAQKKHDPNHLNLGYRFGNLKVVDPRVLKICAEAFDVLSINCYDLKPDPEMLDVALNVANLPVIIGEYHFGTVDRGLAQSLWQVDSQEERGVAYRYYTEQGYSHPALIGTAYFKWSDQDISGRNNDGENYACGLLDVTDRPYKEQVEAMVETAKVLYEVHAGLREPYAQQPKRARGHEAIPDLWNE